MNDLSSSEELKNTKETKLLYLSDTYKFEAESTLILSNKDAKGSFLVLNETIFYPQGGGQPSDTGTIQIDKQILNVYFVSFNNGRVQHYVKDNFENFNYGTLCKMKIDSDVRLRNARTHTGGHLLASIVEKLAPELVGIKGHHFPEGPYVEFKGKLTSLITNELIDKITELAKENIKANKAIFAKDVDASELKNQHNSVYHMQNRKNIRIVQIEGFESVPCGGTHLKNLGEIQNFIVRKIQFSKDNTKIGYLCS